MGNSGGPRPGYDRWVSFPGHGSIVDPVLNIDGDERQHTGYITDLLNEHAVDFLRKQRGQAVRAVLRPQGGASRRLPGGRRHDRSSARAAIASRRRHADLYKGAHFPRRPNVLPPAEVVKDKPAWTEAFELRGNEASRKVLDGIQAGTDEEIRLRAAMMASVDEGMGDVFKALEETGELDNTFILFLGDNGYFFGEHGLGPERRFAYEEGIKSPFLIRYPAWFKPGTANDELVLALDIAPTLVDLAGGKAARLRAHAGPVAAAAGARAAASAAGARSFMCEYFSENAMPWLIGMSYKAIRTKRHKYIHWTQKSLDGVECDELYDLKNDPYEMHNLIGKRGERATVAAPAQAAGDDWSAAVGGAVAEDLGGMSMILTQEALFCRVAGRGVAARRWRRPTRPSRSA